LGYFNRTDFCAVAKFVLAVCVCAVLALSELNAARSKRSFVVNKLTKFGARIFTHF